MRGSQGYQPNTMPITPITLTRSTCSSRHIRMDGIAIPMTHNYGRQKMSTPVERIIPSELSGDELFQCNGEYVLADHYDSLQAQVEVMREALEQALRYVERDELAHGREFGTGNAIRAALTQVQQSSDGERK